MSLTEQKEEELRRNLKDIQTTEDRQAIQISKYQNRMTEDERRTHTIEATVQESLKIKELLANKEDLQLAPEDSVDLLFRSNRNQNFLFMNQEKWSGDSSFMRDIKLQLREYEKLIHGSVRSNENREEMALAAVSLCGELIQSCEAYLSRGKSFFFWRWKRYDAVALLKERMQMEQKILQNVSSENFAEKYKEVIQGTDSLRDLMNTPAMKAKLGRLKSRRQEQNKENETKKTTGSSVEQWEKAIGIPDEVPAAIEKYKSINPMINAESAANLMRLKAIGGEAYRPEMYDAVRGANEKKLYPGVYLNEGDMARALKFPLRVVLRDKNGIPVNEEEQKKADYNKKWAKAVEEANREEMNKILLDALKRFENMSIPSPKELQERGLSWYLKNRPAELVEILDMATTLDNIKDMDPMVGEYYKKHPTLLKKHDAACAFSAYCLLVFQGKNGIYQGSGDLDGTYYRAGNPQLDNSVQFDRMIEVNFVNYSDSYEIAFGKESVRKEVVKHLDEYEEKELRAFHDVYPDEYDQKKHEEINSHLKSDLGVKLTGQQTAESLSEVTEEAYGKLHEGSELTDAEKKTRAQSALSKIKRQKVLRSQMENFLTERQKRQAEGLKHDLVKNKKGIVTENTKDIEDFGKEERYDKRFVNFAMDWTKIDESGPQQLVARFDLLQGDRLFDNISFAGQYLLKVNMKAFEYKNDEEFVSNLQENYVWLKRAESLKEIYEIAKKENRIKSNRLMALSKLEGRLAVFAEIKADYDQRVAMINSPYYALLLNGDVSCFSSEELKQKEEAARNTDPELADFLKNYRLLSEKKNEFKKGSSVTERERKLAEAPKRAEAQRQENALARIEEMGLMPLDNETTEEYIERLKLKLREKAKQAVPEVTEETVRTKRPFIENTIGNLKAGQVVAFENWIGDVLGNEEKLKENGLSESEITELKRLRVESLQARRALDMHEYITNLCADWTEGMLEKKEDNEFVDEHTRAMLAFVYECFANEQQRITVPEGAGIFAEEYYSNALLKITAILAPHKIFYTKDAENVVEKAKAKVKKTADKELEDGNKAVLTIGGKEYTFTNEMNTFSEISGKSVDEKNRPLLETKLSEAQDICITARAINLIRYEAKDNVNTSEFAQYREFILKQLLPIKEDVLKLVK